MPIFAGAVGRKESPRVQQIYNNLRMEIKAISNGQFTEINHNNWALIAGHKPYESSKEKIIIHSNGQGAAIGRFFKSDSRSDELEELLHDLPRLHSEILGSKIWGKYVFIHSDNINGTVHVFRDTMGLAHLYYFEFDGTLFFFSDIFFFLKAVGGLRFLTLDWEPLISFLEYGCLVTSSTPIKEVKEVLPGCYLECNQECCSSKMYFNPTVIPMDYRDNTISKKIIHSFEESINAWINNSDDICLQLSGGLDSSALLLTLKKFLPHNKKLISVNYFDSEVPTSDEYQFAQEVSNLTKVPLIRHEFFF
jgi:asparagine synthase (glutamine-hydrolysing)